jgi:hypothetical protein
MDKHRDVTTDAEMKQPRTGEAQPCLVFGFQIGLSSGADRESENFPSATGKRKSWPRPPAMVVEQPWNRTLRRPERHPEISPGS